MNILKRNLGRQRIAQNYIIRMLDRSGVKAAPIFVDEYHISFHNPKSWNLSKKQSSIFVYFETSHNIHIPIWNNSKNEPMGIKSTTSDLWAHVFADSIWLCRSSDLRNFLFVEPNDKVIQDNTKLVYTPDVILPAIFHRIDNLKIKDFLSKLKELCNAIY